jgi:hypothetical protein
MDLNTSPDGPVTETVAPETVAEPVATPEPTEDDELDAIWDAANAPEETEEAPEPDETPEPETDETPDSEPDPAEPEIETPDGLPVALRDEWKNIPETAREAIVGDRNELHRRLSDMGRQVQGIGPIRDALVQAVENLPQLAEMRPEQVASEVFQLAQMSHAFKTDPVGTMLSHIQRHGLEQAIGQALSGQGVTQEAQNVAAMQAEILSLKSQIERISAPEYLQEQVTNITSQGQVLNDVNQFAANAEHWGEMEQHIPSFIPIVQQKLGEGAAPGAVLEAAYNMALDTFKPDAKAPKPEAVVETAKAPDPEQAERAIRAKSVNVTGKSTGKAREMTEDELLDAAWESAQRA